MSQDIAIGIKAVIDWYYEKATAAKYQNRMHSYISWIEKAKELEEKFKEDLDRQKNP